MFVLNLSLNKNKIFKLIIIVMILIAFSFLIAGLHSFFVLKSQKNSENNFVSESECLPNNEISVINPYNYTNILKEVHENIDNYIGQKLCIEGYIYRLENFNENQFVIARDMDIGNNQALIVGFLCNSNEAKKYSDYTWVKITGEISKDIYNGADIPILKIMNIETIEKPSNPSVPVPSDTYIPTSVIF